MSDTMHTPPPVPPPEKERPPYKTTWMDRGGPDATLRLKAAGYGFMVAGLTVTAAMLIFTIGGVRMTGSILAGIVLVAVLLGTAVGYTAMVVANTSGAVMKAFTFPSGNSTPYEEQFSYQEAMVMRGDMDGALESYEAIIAERPEAVAPRMRAAEHYAARRRNPRRAAELFLEIRRIPDAPVRDIIYSTSRLIDLYDGPLDDPGRALVEMRRVIEQYPDSAVARHAREALPGLKARLHQS